MALRTKTGGRKKGASNKAGYGAKQNILQVFEDIGGVKNFAVWAKDNQTEFYKFYAKLAPVTNEHTGEDGGPIAVNISLDQAARMAREFIAESK